MSEEVLQFEEKDIIGRVASVDTSTCSSVAFVSPCKIRTRF